MNRPTHSEVCFYLVPAGSGNSRMFPTPVGVAMLVSSLPPPRCACLVPDYIERCVTFTPGREQPHLADMPVREAHNLLCTVESTWNPVLLFIVASTGP